MQETDGPKLLPWQPRRFTLEIMSIEVCIDAEKRIVFASGFGTVSDHDLVAYQHDVWSRTDFAGYNEVVDMTHVERVTLPSITRVRELGGVAAAMDAPHINHKLAIVAPVDWAFGLARMYEAYRALNQDSTKSVAVFRSMRPALDWISMV